MPCETTAAEVSYYADREIKQLRRLLCEAVSLIPHDALAANASPVLLAWKVEHDKADSVEATRIRAEAETRMRLESAWDKLTPIERATPGMRERGK